MSILIKGIDMPKERLMITIFPDGTWCGLDNVFHAGDIVEIPKHGRLIDADALLKCIPNEELNSKMAVAYAPTVIEAEE